MINPKLLSDGELIVCLEEMRRRDADALRAISPPEPTEGWQEETRRLVDEQAKDEGLWFQAQTCAEAYVQTALRKLHAAVEGDKSVILPARAMPLQDHGWQEATRRLVDEQAKDEGLWFQAKTCAEAYVQTALRKLHAAVEGDKSVILPARAMVAEDGTKP